MSDHMPSEPRHQCHFSGCDRKRDRGWTTCKRHHTAGISIRQWNARQAKQQTQRTTGGKS